MKKITIKVSNRELRMLENLIYDDKMTYIEGVWTKEKVKKLWRRMVREFVKEKEK